MDPSEPGFGRSIRARSAGHVRGVLPESDPQVAAAGRATGSAGSARPARRGSLLIERPGLAAPQPPRGAGAAPGPDAPVEADAPVTRPSLSGLGVAGLTPRRAGLLLSCLLAGWVAFTFARQVAEASDAQALADAMRDANGSLAAEVSDLQEELALVQEPRYVEQQARAYQLGSKRERPFTLAPDAPPLADDAPGSASRRVGYRPEARSPLDSWLTLLFGPAPGD